MFYSVQWCYEIWCAQRVLLNQLSHEGGPPENQCSPVQRKALLDIALEEKQARRKIKGITEKTAQVHANINKFQSTSSDNEKLLTKLKKDLTALESDCDKTTRDCHALQTQIGSYDGSNQELEMKTATRRRSRCSERFHRHTMMCSTDERVCK
jgi:chromosome segregation ATPase